MTIQINEITGYVIISILSVLCILSMTFFVIVLRKMCNMKHQLEDTNRLLYFNLKSHTQLQESIHTLTSMIDDVQSDVETISSDLEIKIQKDEEKASRKIYPKPDLAKMITSTIKEQIQIEMSLSKNLKAPSGDYVEIITSAVLQTYPEVHPDYLTKKCIALIDDYIIEFQSKRE